MADFHFVSVVLIFIVVILHFTTEAYTESTLIKPPWIGYYPFCSSNITTIDVGSPAVNNINKYWKNMPTFWQEEYSTEHSAQRVDNVVSHDPDSDIGKKTWSKGVNPNYYHDPGSFANRHHGESYYPETNMPYQEPTDNSSTANNRRIEGLHYNGIKHYPLVPL